MHKTYPTIENITHEELIAEYTTLKESHTRYKEVFGSIDNVFTRVNNAGHLEMVSPSVFNIFGYTAEELQGKRVDDYYVDHNDRKRLTEVVNRKGFCDNFQSRVYTKQGDIKVISVNAKYYFDALENKRGVECVIRDITEQKKTEEALNENTLLLNESQRLAHLGHWHWDIVKNVVKWSPELYRIYGLSEKDFDASFEGYLELLHPEDREHVESTIQTILQGTHDQAHFEERIIRKNKDVRYLESWGKLIRKADGTPLKMFGACLDITEKKLADKKILESKKQFQDLFEYSPDARFIYKDDTIVNVNKSFLELYGYTSKEEIIGKSIGATLIDTKKNHPLKNSMAGHPMIPQGLTLASHIKKDGSDFVIEIQSSTIEYEGASHYQVLLRDITEVDKRKEILRAISEIQSTFISEAADKEVFEKMLHTFLKITQSELGLIDEVNQQGGKPILITHAKTTQLNPNSPEISIKQTCLNSLSDLTAKVLATGQPLMYSSPNENTASESMCHFMGLPFYFNNELVGIIGVANNKISYDDDKVRLLQPFIDTCSMLIGARKNENLRNTERIESDRLRKAFTRELEIKVYERTKDLERIQKELSISLEKEKALGDLKSRFISTASHQFRTPLTVIQSSMGVLLMKTDLMDDAIKPAFEKANSRIATQIDRMTTIMNDVLILGKINAGSIALDLEPVNLVELCREIIDNYNEIQEDQREMIFTILGEPSSLDLDSGLISHAISNIVSNAFKYSLGRRSPEMKLVFNDDSIELSIIDYGLGVPKEDLVNLFEPFYRASNVAEITGTGLGTSIAKEYVELNNGTIQINSTIDKGSVFILTFKK